MPNHAYRRQQPTPATTSSGTARSTAAPSNEAMKEAAAAASASGGGVSSYLSELIRDKLGPDQVDDALTGVVDSGGDWVKERMVEAASEKDKGVARQHGGAAVNSITSEVNDAIRESPIGEAVSGFAADHPFLTTGLAAAGVAGYILSDQDINYGTDFSVGKNHKLGLEGEFGSTLRPGFDAARASYTYNDGTNFAHLEGGTRFDRDEWDIQGQYHRKLANGATLRVDGSHRDRGGDTSSKLGVSYDGRELDAYARGSYDSAQDLGRFQAGFSKTGPGPDWRGTLDADTTGRWNASLGVSDRSKDGNLEWYAGLGAGRTAEGETDYQAKAGIKVRF